MNICFVEGGYPAGAWGGGAGSYVQLMGRELVRRGHVVHVIAAPCPGAERIMEDQGVIVHRPSVAGPIHWYISKLGPPGSLVARAIRYLESSWNLHRYLTIWHRQVRFDLIEFNEAGDFFWPLARVCPYVVHLHGSAFTCRRNAWGKAPPSYHLERWLERIFIRHANFVLSPSRALLIEVQNEVSLPASRIAVIPYPLDGRLLEGGPAHPDKSQMVLFAARDDPVKGLDVLLQAIPKVLQHVPEARFQLFGISERAKMALGGHHHAVEVHPFVPKEELLRAYRQAAICVVPSLWDNSPNVVYEAMAAGLPVVASRVGGIPELVEDQVTGILVPSRDPEALAEALVKLLKDAMLREQMGRMGHQRIVQLADVSIVLEQHIAIYERIKNSGKLKS